MSMLDALKYQNMARNDPGEYYRQTPIMRAAAERNLGGWLGQAYDQDIKPAYDAWTPQASDLYNVPKTIAQALGGAVKDSTDTLNAAAPLAMAGDDEATAQAAKASFDLASMYGGSTAAASLAGGVPRGAVLGAHVFQGGPHKYGPEGASESLKHMSKGEGAQAYGWGRYDAESKGVAQDYKNTLGNKVKQEVVTPEGRKDAIDFAVETLTKGISGDKLKGAEQTIRAIYGDMTVTQIRDAMTKSVIPTARGQRGLEKDKWADLSFDETTEAYLYKHDLPDEDIARYLDYDAPLSEQPEAVARMVASTGKTKQELIDLDNYHEELSGRYLETPEGTPEFDRIYQEWNALQSNPDRKLGATLAQMDKPDNSFGGSPSKSMTGQKLYESMGIDKQAASEALAKAGIPGLKYYDGMSRGQVGGATATNIRERIAGAEASNSNLRKAIEDGDLGPGNDPHKMQLAKGEAEVRGWQKELVQHDSNATRNYVTWDQEVLDRMKLLERNNEDMTKALMQK